jgi:hypothetical protein
MRRMRFSLTFSLTFLVVTGYAQSYTGSYAGTYAIAYAIRKVGHRLFRSASLIVSRSYMLLATGFDVDKVKAIYAEVIGEPAPTRGLPPILQGPTPELRKAGLCCRHPR